MLIPTQDGGYVNRQAIRRLRANADGDGAIAELADGREVELLYTSELITAMDGVVLPANDGFTKLIFRFQSQELERHPIIGWRVIGIEPPLAITPQQDGTFDEASIEAVKYPDGQIIVGLSQIFTTIPSFQDYCREQRIEWLKDHDPRG